MYKKIKLEKVISIIINAYYYFIDFDKHHYTDTIDYFLKLAKINRFDRYGVYPETDHYNTIIEEYNKLKDIEVYKIDLSSSITILVHNKTISSSSGDIFNLNKLSSTFLHSIYNKEEYKYNDYIISYPNNYQIKIGCQLFNYNDIIKLIEFIHPIATSKYKLKNKK